MTVIAGLIGRVTSYLAVAANLTLPGLLVAVAVVLFQAPTTTRSPFQVLLHWSSLNEPIAKRLNALHVELDDRDARLRAAQSLVAAAPAGDAVAIEAAKAHVANQQALWDAIHGEMVALRTQRGQRLLTLAERLVGNIIALGLLGLAIGTLLRPLNTVTLAAIEWRYARSDTLDAARAKIAENEALKDEYDTYYSRVEAIVALVLPVLFFSWSLSKWTLWVFALGVPVAIVLGVLAHCSYKRFDAHVRRLSPSTS